MPNSNCSNVFTSADSHLYISQTEPSCTMYQASSFTTMTWYEVADITDLGEFGKEYEVISYNPLDKRGTIKRKGSYNNGSIDLELGKASSDAGQQKLDTALDDDDNYSFKIVLQEGTTFFFTAKVTKKTTSIGSANNIVSSNVTLEIVGDIIEIPGGGSGATATATVNAGAVATASVTQGGTGYAAPPAISFTGGGGTGAKAYAVVNGAAVTSIVITAGGTGYTVAPTVVITPT